jgi:integration host factor subunit alpha
VPIHVRERALRATTTASFRACYDWQAITRVELYQAVHRKVGLSHLASSTLVELVLKEISECLERGETVKLSSFGTFLVRKKGPRLGRNPKTGDQAPIPPRRVLVFKPSGILKQEINPTLRGKQEPAGSIDGSAV